MKATTNNQAKPAEAMLRKFMRERIGDLAFDTEAASVIKAFEEERTARDAARRSIRARLTANGGPCEGELAECVKLLDGMDA